MKCAALRDGSCTLPQQTQQLGWKRNGPRFVVWLALVATMALASCGPSEVGRPNEIPQVEVSSTAMRSVGYGESQQVLIIEFPNGSVYEYQGVPAKIHSGLMQAKSHGQYFHEHIRNAGYKTNRLR